MLVTRRIPNARLRLRPPNTFSPSYQPPNPRSFKAGNVQLLLVARPSLRPQLPFLHPSTLSRVTPTFRLLSTESKERWKERGRWQFWFHTRFWPGVLLVIIAYSGIDQAKLEREWPTPRDWTFWSRWYLRSAKHAEFDSGRLVVDWMRVAFYYELLIPRLEGEQYDGAALLEQDAGGIYVEGVGKTGYNISMKTEPWRRGYYEALMGAARVAEHLDGMVRTKDRKCRERFLRWPKECAKSESNPRPVPVPFGWEPCPPEEQVEPAWQTPQVWYMRILTTKGFSNKQRLDAAIAYADWLDFKGLNETAESMYDWALDIAAGGLPTDVGADAVVDRKTGVLNSSKTLFVTENLLKATTALAVHHAQKGDVKAALPIFLSILKARKDLPPEPKYEAERRVEEQATQIKTPGGDSYLNSIWLGVRDWLIDAPYPPRPSDGDSRPYHTLKEACEEVGLMAYIGEILYATSSKEKGLSWTRDAVDAAEAIMWVMDEEQKDNGKDRCRECLSTGLENWKKMARSMATAAEKNELEIMKNSGWLKGNREKAAAETKRWQEEEAQIELRRQKTMPLLTPLKAQSGGWFSV